MRRSRFASSAFPRVRRHRCPSVRGRGHAGPGVGQVRLKVAATTFNGVDANIRAGLMQGPIPVSLPHIPGLDLAGTVDTIGEAVTNLQVGDQVVGFLPMVDDGASAEYAIAAADILAPAPTSIPLADAAALPLVRLTASQALFISTRLQGGAARADQRRRWCGRRLRRAAGQIGWRACDSNGKPTQQ